MMYIKRFESFDTDSYIKSISDSDKAYYARVNATKPLVDKMNPPCEEVATDISDIFLEYTDQGIILDQVELAVPNPDSTHPFAVYYPLGWQGKTKKYYYPTYGDIGVDSRITSIMEKTGKLYYDITFEYDLREVKGDKERLDQVFSLVHECADYIFKRLNNMYKINVINSVCYLPNNDWKQCDPVPDESVKTAKISWLLEIN